MPSRSVRRAFPFLYGTTLEPLNRVGILSRATIASLIAGDPPLVSHCQDLERQLQPNGFDVTLRSVSSFSAGSAPGGIGISDRDRKLTETVELTFGDDGWLHLQSGQYLITFNEIVNLPLHIMALARPRSSLLRSGVAIHTAVWDAGYSGRSQALMTVHHPQGFRVQQDARVAQMVFMYLDAGDAQGYTGRYQDENL